MLKQFHQQDLKKLKELMTLNAALHHTNLIEKLEMAQNNKPDEETCDEIFPNNGLIIHANLQSITLIYYINSLIYSFPTISITINSYS